MGDAEQQPRRVPWCGNPRCDPTTRQLDYVLNSNRPVVDPEDEPRPRRCPVCHPLRPVVPF
jgi:hypothetical protein